jgi:large subunit ribosomal protein L9
MTAVGLFPAEFQKFRQVNNGCCQFRSKGQGSWHCLRPAVLRNKLFFEAGSHKKHKPKPRGCPVNGWWSYYRGIVMEVILSKDIQTLGKLGEVVKVKNGYARNYLLPRKLAYVATPSNLKRIEQQEKKNIAQRELAKKEAQELAEKLSKVSCTLSVEVNDLDKLYGAIAETDIAKALEIEGFMIDKKDIVIEKPIEELGIFDVDINLHSGVTAKIRLWVTKK